VVVPIDVDEQGEILDGHHRYRAWVDLQKNEPPPTIVREGLSEQARFRMQKQHSAPPPDARASTRAYRRAIEGFAGIGRQPNRRGAWR
jgi:hypothetical protein